MRNLEKSSETNVVQSFQYSFVSCVLSCVVVVLILRVIVACGRLVYVFVVRLCTIMSNCYIPELKSTGIWVIPAKINSLCIHHSLTCVVDLCAAA